MSYRNEIDFSSIPNHIAIIMDGNGRWAKRRLGQARIFGHKNGVNAVRDATEGAGELGVKYLTLYAFSTENWARPQREVKALMELLIHTIKSETPRLLENGVRLNAIGDIESLPQRCKDYLRDAMKLTADNDGLTLTLALSYSSRWELTEAMKKIAEDVKAGKIAPDHIDEALIGGYLETKDIPDPDLLIRTSGEQRISNYLLWQIAYSELYFTDTLWPDFNKEELFKAILSYQNRERRFGKVSEQISAE